MKIGLFNDSNKRKVLGAITICVGLGVGLGVACVGAGLLASSYIS